MDNKFCKFYKWQKYVSYDNGLTWSPLNEYAKGELYESLSVDCGGGSIIYRWVSIDEYACEEVQDKYTYNFSNGDGIVIACGEGDVNINNEHSGSGNFKMAGGGALGSNATSTCDGVTSTTVHNCVSNVPYQYAWAFGALEEATIEDGITSIDKEAFADCISLTNVSMPNTIETIDEFAFRGCYSLKNITLSENLKTLKKGAFMSTSLSAITIPSQVKKIGYAAGDDSHIVPYAAYGGSTSRYEGVFMNTDLVTVTLNEGLEIIGAKTFNGCKLREFTAPSTLKVLGYEGAGYTLSGDSTSPTYRYATSEIGVLNCTSLSSVTLNEGLEIIGNNCFRGCSSLTSVTIPSTVEAMYMNVFEGCSSLQYIKSLPTIPPPIYNFSSTSVFQPFDRTNNCLIYVPDESVDAYKSASVWSDVKKRIVPLSSFVPLSGNKFEATYSDGTTYAVLCTQAEGELTGEDVRIHPSYENMISAKIGDCITKINDGVFYGCSSLKTLDLGNGVKTIGDRAFYNCSGLTSLTIPSSVIKIYSTAFSACRGLTSITCLPETPPELWDSYVFAGNDCPIYVPAESVDAYKTADIWSSYANRIRPLNQ